MMMKKKIYKHIKVNYINNLGLTINTDIRLVQEVNTKYFFAITLQISYTKFVCHKNKIYLY